MVCVPKNPTFALSLLLGALDGHNPLTVFLTVHQPLPHLLSFVFLFPSLQPRAEFDTQDYAFL
jgi:hypothetical protein